MWHTALGVLALAGIAAAGTGSHWIVLPNALTPGYPLPMTFSFYNTTEDVKVQVDLIKDDHHLIQTMQHVFQQGEPGMISIQVPNGLPYQSRYTLLVHGLSGLYFNEHAQLRYDTGYRAEKFAIFIQTDKAIYKPGQTVRFRAFGMYSNMTVYTGMFDVSIYDPKNNKIKQWINMTSPEYGVLENYMVMDTEPPLGDWRIQIRNNEHGVTETKSFTIGKYVLPKFDVTLELPPYVLTSDKSLKGTVKATYTYGKPVTGTVKVKADLDYYYSPWKYHGDEVMVETKFNTTGESPFTVPLDRIMNEVDPNSYVPLVKKLAGYHVTLEVSVTESLNNLTRTAKGSVRFYDEPYIVRFDTSNSPQYFKPGLPFTAYASISQADGRPVTSTNKDVQVLCYTKFYDNTVHKYRAHTLWTKMFVPPPSGLLSIDVDTPEQAQSLHLEVHYKGFTASFNANRPGWLLANGTLQLHRRSAVAAIGKNVDFELLSVDPILEVFYMVLANNLVVHTGRVVSQSTNTSLTISFPVTTKMEPYAQLIVYYFSYEDDWNADSIYFNVNDGSEIFKNKVALDFDKTTAEPGQNISLQVTTDPKSLVSILAVDQSVLLMKTGNDITQGDVISSLKTATAPSGSSNYYAQHNPRTVLQASDIQVLTDVSGFSWAHPYYKRQIDCGPNSGSGSGGFRPGAFPTAFPPPGPNGHFAGSGGTGTGILTGGVFPTAAPMIPGKHTDFGKLQNVQRIRTFFPETWLWTNVTSGADGHARISAAVPDTITSWVASAFSVNKMSGLGVADAPAKFRTFRPFFVSLNLPYSVVRGEEVVLQANVFNYMSQDMDVVATLEKSMEFMVIVPNNASGNVQYVAKAVVKQVKVLAGKAQSVYIPIVPAALGKIDISVKAQSALAADGVRRQLLVEPEGVLMEYNVPTMVTAGQTVNFPLKFPNTLVSDSERITVTAIGDVMGPTLKNLNSLLRLPTGCGEQTMTNFAPDVFVANYLNLTGQFTSAIRSMAVDYMEKGYQRELTFQRTDGSFSIWGDRDYQGSMWLTAFAVKSFHQAKPYIYVSDRTLYNAIGWILNRQKYDGSFPVVGSVHSSMLKGGSSVGISLTSFVLIALLENSDLHYSNINYRINTGAAKARAYLEAHINEIQNIYDLAIVSYALRLSGSSRASITYSRLDKRAQMEGGMKYWSTESLTPTMHPVYMRWYDYYERKSPASVEATAYALLYNVHTPHSPTEVLKILKWLVSQRNERGGFSSTQDTVIALQAMSEYKALTSGTLDLNVDVSVGNFTDQLHVQRRDALVLKSTSVPYSALPQTNASVNLAATGSGSALAQVSVSFHVEQEEISPSFNVSVNIKHETLRSIVVESCFLSTIGGYGGMSVVEFGIPTGFTPELSSSNTNTTQSKKTETKNRMVVLYYDEIPNTQYLCATVEMVRTELVAKSKPASIRVYDYYAPNNRALKFFESKLLKDSSFCDICADCGCQQTVIGK